MAPPRDESFFDRLTRLFRSGPSIRRKIRGFDDVGYYDKQAVLAARGGSGNGMMPFRKGTSHNSPFSMLGGADLMSRMTRYMEFAEMEYTPVISKALDVQADEACSGDENGKNFHIYSDNADVKEALEELFYDILNVDFNLRVWIRNLLKYGDLFLYNEVAPGVGVVNAMALNVNEVERIEDFDPNDPYAVRFHWNKNGKKVLENWQVTHFRILGNDQFTPYGTSVLESARRIWRQYVMMLDAMLVYRLVRSPERRVFYVDVGTVAPNDIPNFMNTIMSTIRGQTAVDKETGRLDERFNPTDVLEDYIVPVRGANSGTRIDTLQGGTHATATEDIEIIQSQLFAALGVPKAYLGYDDMLSSKATLAQEDIRFSRTIQIYQKIIVSELNKLAILHLYALGFEGEDLIDFQLRLSNPSSVALQQKLDLWKTKIDIISAVDQIETRFLPMEWLYREILGFTEDEIKGLREQLKADKRFAVELDSIVDMDTTGENVVDPFDPSSYLPPGGSNTQDNTLPTPPVGMDLPGAPPSPGAPADAVTSQTVSPVSLKLGKGEVPIKVNPQVRMDKRNARRRKSDLSIQANQPDFAAMLHPGKNASLRDLYDQNFLKDPLSEEIQKDLRRVKTSIPRDIRNMLERFDKATGRKKMLTETKAAPVQEDEVVIDFDGESELDLSEVFLKEASGKKPLSFTTLAKLGLEIKEGNPSPETEL